MVSLFIHSSHLHPYDSLATMLSWIFQNTVIEDSSTKGLSSCSRVCTVPVCAPALSEVSGPLSSVPECAIWIRIMSAVCLTICRLPDPTKDHLNQNGWDASGDSAAEPAHLRSITHVKGWEKWGCDAGRHREMEFYCPRQLWKSFAT